MFELGRLILHTRAKLNSTTLSEASYENLEEVY